MVMKKAAKAAPNNRVEEIRESLGLTKVELARLANLSDKTIARVERQERGFRNVTYSRILNAVNAVRARKKVSELAMNDLFPGLTKK